MHLQHRTPAGPEPAVIEVEPVRRRPEPHRVPPPLVWAGVAGVALVGVAGCAVFAPPLWALSQTAAAAIEGDAALVGGLVRIVLVMGTMGVCLIVLGVARWLWRRADVAGVLRLPGDAPIAYTDLRRAGAALAQQLAAAHYEVQGRLADAAAEKVPQHYAPSISYRYDSRNDAPPALPEPVQPAAAPPLDAGRAALPQLADKGLLRSDRLLAGFEGAAPLYIDLALTGFVAVAGQARSGKTTAALGLMAQAAYAGATVFVADPHARVADGLLHRATPLSGRFERQAVTDDEIARVIALVAKIARRRLDGLDAADQPVLLVVDEFTALVARRALPDDALAALLSVAVEAPKVKVHGLLLAQDWSARLLGAQMGASLRRVVTHRLVHRSDPGNADFLLPSGALARQVATLDRGAALFWPADGVPVAVSVPNLGTEDDLRFAARGVPPKPYVPRPALVAPPSAAPTPPPPALTLAGRIKALLADGQPRRFLYAVPESLLGRRRVDAPPVPAHVRAVYAQRITALLSVTPATDPEGRPAAHTLSLSPGAATRIRDFAEALEPRLGPWGDLDGMTDWGGKLAGAVVRIAGLLHMAAAGPAWLGRPVDAATVDAAVRIGRYLTEHARAAFAQMGADEGIAAAQHVLKWIERNGAATFTKSAIYTALKGTYKRADALNEPLNVLIEHGYIRRQPPPADRKAGRPAEIYEVNPIVLQPSSNSSNSINPAPAPVAAPDEGDKWNCWNKWNEDAPAEDAPEVPAEVADEAPVSAAARIARRLDALKAERIV